MDQIIIPIHEKAMLVSFTASYWSGRKYDKRVTDTVDTLYNARNSGRYNKILCSNMFLADIIRQMNFARNYHYSVTMPWTDTGSRLLPSELYFDYVQDMRVFKQGFIDKVNFFIELYKTGKVLEDAKSRLGDIFNESDYPMDLNDLRSRFSFDINVYPIPHLNDFRLRVDGSVLISLQKQLYIKLSENTLSAKIELWKRLEECLVHMENRLSQPDAQFHYTLISNLREVCDLIPKMNIFGDVELNRVAALAAPLGLLNVDKLRTDTAYRAFSASQADRILASVRKGMDLVYTNTEGPDVFV